MINYIKNFTIIFNIINKKMIEMEFVNWSSVAQIKDQLFFFFFLIWKRKMIKRKLKVRDWDSGVSCKTDTLKMKPGKKAIKPTLGISYYIYIYI